jgi:hypothetical protein
MGPQTEENSTESRICTSPPPASARRPHTRGCEKMQEYDASDMSTASCFMLDSRPYMPCGFHSNQASFSWPKTGGRLTFLFHNFILPSHSAWLLPPSPPCFISLNSHSPSSYSLLLPSRTQSTFHSLVVRQVIVTSTIIFLQRSICKASTTQRGNPTHLAERGRALNQYRPSTWYESQSVAAYFNKFIVTLVCRFDLCCTYEHRNTVSMTMLPACVINS